MESSLVNIANKTIDNYKLAKNSLRYDGEYINHFASLIYADKNNNIDILKVKNIRRYIKSMTKNMSSFRGDILYMLSILISTEENYKNLVDCMLDINTHLEDNGFNESAYLALSSYSIAKRARKNELDNVLNNMKTIYSMLKKEFKNIINEEDYLICSLLAIKCAREKYDVNETGKFIQSMFNYLTDLDDYSRNDLQEIACTLLLNSSSSAPYEIKELIKTFEENDMKIGDELLNIISVVAREDDIVSYVKKVKEVVEYLCEEEGEYAFYMDKTFRTMIGIAIVELNERKEINFTNKYLKELLCFSVYSFIVSKKQGVFEEVLA